MRDKRGVGKKDPSKYRTITYFLGNECDVYVVTGEATITSTTTEPQRNVRTFKPRPFNFLLLSCDRTMVCRNSNLLSIFQPMTAILSSIIFVVIG